MSDWLAELGELGELKKGNAKRSYAKTPKQIVSALIEHNIKWLSDSSYKHKNAQGKMVSPAKCFLEKGGMAEVFALYMRKRVELAANVDCVEVLTGKVAEALNLIKAAVDAGELDATLAKMKAAAPRRGGRKAK